MELLEKINQRKASIGVVGLGYVGLPLLLEFVNQQFHTLGFDIDIKKIDLLKEEDMIHNLRVAESRG